MYSPSETTYYNLHQHGTEAVHNQRDEQKSIYSNSLSTTMLPKCPQYRGKNQPQPEMVQLPFSIIMNLDSSLLGTDPAFPMLQIQYPLRCTMYFKQALYCLILCCNCVHLNSWVSPGYLCFHKIPFDFCLVCSMKELCHSLLNKYFTISYEPLNQVKSRCIFKQRSIWHFRINMLKEVSRLMNVLSVK